MTAEDMPINVLMQFYRRRTRELIIVGLLPAIGQIKDLIMNFSHQNTVKACNAAYDFPKIDVEVDWERQTWMEANCGDWPYFYDVVDWPGAFAGSSGWELHEDLTTWLYTNRRLDCNDHYGIVCFAQRADAIRFKNRFAP
jgi:hypothetical protein